MSQVEHAAVLCQLGKELLWGNKAKGDFTSVSLPGVSCGCPTGAKPIGLWHTHPSDPLLDLFGFGKAELSQQDKSEAKRLGMAFMCVSVPEKKITKCHRV
uniref:JAB domain-containing protein n=1 Tax=viral metagenome TaxID=1070528 RepID=A0A6M3ITG4_9ZZZZ